MKKIFLNICLLALACIVFLVFLEITIRACRPIYAPSVHCAHKCEDFVEYNSSYGWFNKKDFTTWIENQEYKTKIFLNKKGLRGKEYSYEKQPGVKRIIVLGDSFAFGFGVNDEDAFSVKLEELFRKSGEAADVINMGVEGYGTDQEYLLLKEEGIKYHPDIAVCLFFVGNDIENCSSGTQYHKLKPYFIREAGKLELKNYPVPVENEFHKIADNGNYEERGNINMPFKSFFQRHSYAYVFLRLRYSYLLYKMKIKNSDGHSEEKNGLDIVEGIFLKMKALCEDNNCKLIIVIVPTKEQAMGIETDNTQRYLTRFGRQNNLIFLDLLEVLRGRKDLNFVIDSHWNKKGHAFIADYLYDKLKKR